MGCGKKRYERYFSASQKSDEDSRHPGQRDRDRILYTSAFRRLAGITQVVAPAEGHVFHNRLTHSLEVAQIGRRLAERLLSKYGEDLADGLGGIDPEVVEAATLAHDLGHPPFGHIAEQTLCELLDKHDSSSEHRRSPLKTLLSRFGLGESSPTALQDGFEGNAQSFRIVTRLAVRYPETISGQNITGLNLTRATLRAMSKYPWSRSSLSNHNDKWGTYSSEEHFLNWAKVPRSPEHESRSVEAELMDWADDVAYAVHDMEDFYRAGLIPLERLIKEGKERDNFLDRTFKRLGAKRALSSTDKQRLQEALSEILLYVRVREPYQGSRSQRAELRNSTSFFIGRYINSVELVERNSEPIQIADDYKAEVTMLKQLTWDYVIENPALETQQHGQKRVIKELFDVFMDAANSNGGSKTNWTMFPVGYREELEKTEELDNAEKEQTRIVTDLIASMTEQQALKMYQRLTGVSLGSVLDPTSL